MQRFRHVVILICAGLLLVVSSARAEKIRVVTSFLPVYCFTVNVAGDFAQVENLLPAGVGPHDYQFAPRDRRKVAQADLMIVNGLGLESWLDQLLTSDGQKKTVVEAAAGLNGRLIRDTDHDAHGEEVNPHIWLDPQLACHAVTNIMVALQKRDPANKAGYARNAAAFIDRLQKLDREIQEKLAPVRDRSFVTFHNAFPYFVRHYGLKLAGVIEETPEVNPSPRYRAKLMATMREKKARAVYVEPQFPKEQAEQLTKDLEKDLNIKLATLDTLETGPLTPTAYEDGMRKNVRVLEETLK